MSKNSIFTKVPSYKDFSFNKSLIERCEKAGINVNVVSPHRKQLLLLHKYLETGFVSIVAFADSYSDLWDIMYSHPRYGSSRHYFLVTVNTEGVYANKPSSHPLFEGSSLNGIKDSALINICKNVGELLAVGEYSLLKKSYFKSQVWFEKAKHSASLGAEILDNY